MKRILVNMNRSGYFWHELTDVPSTDSNPEAIIVKMKREISADSHPSLTAMRTYEQYNYVFMKGNGDYILAIRNLNDPRTDGSGRSLKQHVIFEDDDKDLLLKLLAFYLSSSGDFEEWITGDCFKPGQNDALCKLVPFNKKIEEIRNCQLDSRLRNCEFAISSLQNAKWLQEKLQINGASVEDYLNKLDALRGEALLVGAVDIVGIGSSKVVTNTVNVSKNTTGKVNDTTKQFSQTTTEVSAGGEEENDTTRQVAKIQQELKKWKWCAVALATIAGGSILVLLYNAINK